MMTARTQYLNLIKDLQHYINEEHSSDTWIEVSQDSYAEYKNWYAQSKQATRPIQAPTETRAKTIERTVVRQDFKKPEYKKPEYKDITYKTSSSLPAILTSADTILDKHRPILTDLTDIKKVIQDKFPDLTILDHIPDDSKAKIVKSQWKLKNVAADLTIIVNGLTPLQKAFLSNVCQAIHISLSKHAKVYDKQNASKSPENCPTLILDDIDIYFREPNKKHELWLLIKKTFE